MKDCPIVWLFHVHSQTGSVALSLSLPQLHVLCQGAVYLGPHLVDNVMCVLSALVLLLQVLLCHNVHKHVQEMSP